MQQLYSSCFRVEQKKSLDKAQQMQQVMQDYISNLIVMMAIAEEINTGLAKSITLNLITMQASQRTSQSILTTTNAVWEFP